MRNYPPVLDREVVLLMDESVWRPVVLDSRQSISRIVEREHLAPNVIHERIWFWRNDERALTGQRIFREAPKPPIVEPGEHPLFDELVIKKPLPFWTPPKS